MERTIEELIDLGPASVETKGAGGLPRDIKQGQGSFGLTDD